METAPVTISASNPPDVAGRVPVKGVQRYVDLLYRKFSDAVDAGKETGNALAKWDSSIYLDTFELANTTAKNAAKEGVTDIGTLIRGMQALDDAAHLFCQAMQMSHPILPAKKVQKTGTE